MLTTTAPRLKRLSPEETLLASYQDTDQRLNAYRLSDHEQLKQVEKRAGQMMTSSEFIQRVEKVTHREVWAEKSLRSPGVLGFYHVKNREKTYVCAFDEGVLPEHSIIEVDNADLPVKERRGWRTVLTRLLQSGAMSWPQILHSFSDTHSAVSERWRFNTREFRAKG